VKIKSQKDFWAGLMFLVAGLVFAWGATAYKFGTSAKPGPGYFPLGLGVLLAALGALTLFGALTIETEDGGPIGAWSWRPLSMVLVSVVLFGLLLPRAGLVLTIPVLVLVASLADGEFNWRDVLIGATVLTLGSWAVFVAGLKLAIPLWPAFAAGWIG
jgi:hypothetical protein